MILKTITLIVALVVGSKGYFLQGASPVRGQSQGHYWPEYEKLEENVDNRYYYQSPSYQHYLDHQRYYQQHAAQTVSQVQSAVQPLVQTNQEVYQQESPLQNIQTVQNIYPDADNLYTQQLPLIPNYQYFGRYQSPASPVVHHPGTPTQTTIPLLVRLPNNQALVVPVRAVYTLPPFLEKIVQRVQGYYSIYNPIEELTLDRPLFAPTSTTTSSPPNALSAEAVEGGQDQKAKISTTTESSETETTTPKEESSTNKVSTLAVYEVTTTTSPSSSETETSTDEQTTESEIETTTDPANYISPDASTTDLEGGYSYNRPSGRSLKYN